MDQKDGRSQNNLIEDIANTIRSGNRHEFIWMEHRTWAGRDGKFEATHRSSLSVSSILILDLF